MKALKKVLHSYYKSPTDLGGDLDIDREKLKEELEAVIQRNGKVFWLNFSLLIMLFLVTLILVFTHAYAGNPIRFTLGAAGLSFPFIMNLMIKAAQEKKATEMLISLTTAMSDETIQLIIGVLVKRI